MQTIHYHSKIVVSFWMKEVLETDTLEFIVIKNLGMSHTPPNCTAVVLAESITRSDSDKTESIGACDLSPDVSNSSWAQCI